MKQVFLHLSLLCINIYSMDNSGVLNQNHISPEIMPYIEAIADLYEEMNLEFNKDIKYVGEFKNQIDKPIFQKIIELLSQSIKIINNKPVNQIVNRDWGNILKYIAGENLSLDQLISMLEVIDFLRIPLLEKPILIGITHTLVMMLKKNKHKAVKKALKLILTDYQNEIKHLLYDYYPLDIWLAWDAKMWGWIKSDWSMSHSIYTDDRNHRLIYSSDTIKVQDNRNQTLLYTIKLGPTLIKKLWISNNYIVITTTNSEIMIWDVRSGFMINDFVINSKEINVADRGELFFTCTNRLSLITHLVDGKLMINYGDKKEEHSIIDYIHENNLKDILKTVYPNNSTCSIL